MNHTETMIEENLNEALISFENQNNSIPKSTNLQIWGKPNVFTQIEDENSRLIKSSDLSLYQKGYEAIISRSNKEDNFVVTADPFLKFFRDIFEHCDSLTIIKIKIEADSLFDEMINTYCPKITDCYEKEEICIEEIQVLADQVFGEVMLPFLNNLNMIISPCVADKEAFSIVMENFRKHIEVHFAIEFGMNGEENSKIDYSKDSMSKITKNWLLRSEETKNLTNYYQGKKDSKKLGIEYYNNWMNNLGDTGKRIGYNYDLNGKKEFIKDSEGKINVNQLFIKDDTKKNKNFLTSESKKPYGEKNKSKNHDEEESQSTKNREVSDENICINTNWVHWVCSGLLILTAALFCL